MQAELPYLQLVASEIKQLSCHEGVRAMQELPLYQTPQGGATLSVDASPSSWRRTSLE
jgi:hypothetical protein